MSFYQAGELDALRAEYLTSLDRTCTVSAPGSVTNVGDGTWEEGVTTASGVPCAFMATAGDEGLAGGAVAEVGNYIVRFKWDRVLTPKASVAVAATADLPAKTFQLVAPLDHGTPIGQRWLATEG